MSQVTLQKDPGIQEILSSLQDTLGSPSEAASCRAAVAIAGAILPYIRNNILVIYDQKIEEDVVIRFVGNWIQNPEQDTIGLYYHGRLQQPTITVSALMNRYFSGKSFGRKEISNGPKQFQVYVDGKCKTKPSRALKKLRAHITEARAQS